MIKKTENQENPHLVGLEPGVVQLPERVLHVLVLHVLDDAGAVAEHVREADVAGLAHVVLQVLPGTGGGKAWKEGALLCLIIFRLFQLYVRGLCKNVFSCSKPSCVAFKFTDDAEI